jgi:hypothetical protein
MLENYNIRVEEMSYLFAVPFVTILIILAVVAVYLIADAIKSSWQHKSLNGGPNGHS